MSTLVGGTLYLVFTQVASRGLTFIGNQILLRYLSPTLLGIAVQLELVSVTVLYFARESLRVALQRQPAAANDTTLKEEEKHILQRQSQSAVNLSYLAVALGVLIALVSGFWYLRVADIEVSQSPQFTEAFYVYAVATFVELCAEPYFVVIQQHGRYRERARAETSSAVARCIFACLTAFVARRHGLPPSVLPYAIGQLAYSVVLFAFYFLAASQPAREQAFGLIPQKIMETSLTSTYIVSLFNKPILLLAATMYLQSVFKLLLTEGNHLILSFLSSLADQGAFALAANYGGLLARLVFQPIEESSRNTFGRLLVSAPTSSTPGVTKQNHASYGKPTDRTNTTLALSHLSTTLRIYTLFSLPLVSLLPPLIPHLLPLLLSSMWRNPSTTALLSTYVYYIPFLAVNGILDAFVTSVATPRQLRLQSVYMAGCTIVYGGMCWVFLSRWGWGSEGLVWGNVGNMVLRIGWGAWFVDGWVKENAEQGDEEVRKRFWRDSMPNAQCVLMAAAVGSWLKSSYGIGAGEDGAGMVGKKVLPGSDLGLGDLGKVVTAALLLGSMMSVLPSPFYLLS